MYIFLICLLFTVIGLSLALEEPINYSPFTVDDEPGTSGDPDFNSGLLIAETGPVDQSTDFTNLDFLSLEVQSSSSPNVEQSNVDLLAAGCSTSSTADTTLGKRGGKAICNGDEFNALQLPDFNEWTNQLAPPDPENKEQDPLSELKILMSPPDNICFPKQPYHLCCICDPEFAFLVCQKCLPLSAIVGCFAPYLEVCCERKGEIVNPATGRTNLQVWTALYPDRFDPDKFNNPDIIDAGGEIAGEIAEYCREVGYY